jgi:hypothetical protein
VLCTIKIFQGGVQQVTPGFSEEECDSEEEEGPYRSIRTMRIAKTRGHRLTTFHFTGFKNFRYTVENLNSEVLTAVEEVCLYFKRKQYVTLLFHIYIFYTHSPGVITPI